MHTTRTTFTADTLASRMRKFDTYVATNRSARPIASPRARQNPQSPMQSYSASANVVVQKNIQKAILTQKPPVFRNVQSQPKLDLALQSVRSAHPTHEDVLAEQFAGVNTYSGKRILTRAQKLFYGIGIAIFIFATGASIQTFVVNKDAKEQLQVLGEQTQKPDEYGVPEGSGSEPAEAEVSASAINAYKVNPELPRYLRIPDLGVFARIKHTGVDKNGAIDAPGNVNDVSWYNESARPGNEIGSSLLLGHVSGWTAPGVFKKINQLKAGMRFEVEKGSGEKLTYEVVRGESIPLEQLDMAKVLATEVAGEHDLKLMTCSGRYNKEKDHYEERYIVYAKILR